MNILGPTRHARLNEAAGVVLLLAALFVALSLVSYDYQDTSWNTVAAVRPHNLTGNIGAHIADACIQLFGFSAFALPVLMILLAWKWVRSAEIQAHAIRVCGSALLLMSICTIFALLPKTILISGVVPAGGLMGIILADYLSANMNTAGAVILTAAATIVSIYLLSTFTMSKLAGWFAPLIGWFSRRTEALRAWKAERARIASEKAAEKARIRAEKRAARRQAEEERRAAQTAAAAMAMEPKPSRRNRVKEEPEEAPIVDVLGTPPWEETSRQSAPEPQALAAPESGGEEIPIRQLEAYQPPSVVPMTAQATLPPEPATPARSSRGKPKVQSFRLPSTALLNEPPPRNPYDSQELKETAARIKSKLEEFNVRGSVVQINPGPVVTTFEFKPEAGIKYSRITTLTEDLCLGLEAESVLIERIPGKPTVGIEVPNSRREVISLRQMIESEEFQNSPSPMTMPLGKDINGRIKVAALDSMPHLLIAGSTGSGKSVMPHIDPDSDLTTKKLPALHFYQLAIKAPRPRPAKDFDPPAAKRGDGLFSGKAQCNNCHVEPIWAEPGWNLHTGAEVCIDDFQADRAPDHRYRTSPLAGLFTHQKGGFFHDGRFATSYDVVDHYNSCFGLKVTEQEKNDVVQYLLSL